MIYQEVKHKEYWVLKDITNLKIPQPIRGFNNDFVIDLEKNGYHIEGFVNYQTANKAFWTKTIFPPLEYGGERWTPEALARNFNKNIDEVLADLKAAAPSGK